MSRMDADLPVHLGEDRPHRPADDKEEVYFEGSPLLRGELGRAALFAAIGLILMAAPFVYRGFTGEWWPWWVNVPLVVIGIGMMFVPLLLIKSIRYRVSNYRIDYERGILSRRVDTLELWHVDDLSLHQSLLDRMLGVGTITVRSNDKSTPTLLLSGVPHPRPLFDNLKQRVIAVKRQRGVIKMDMG
jgi:membrane protein YdbS with pleckstrin-like domain